MPTGSMLTTSFSLDMILLILIACPWLCPYLKVDYINPDQSPFLASPGSFIDPKPHFMSKIKEVIVMRVLAQTPVHSV